MVEIGVMRKNGHHVARLRVIFHSAKQGAYGETMSVMFVEGAMDMVSPCSIFCDKTMLSVPIGSLDSFVEVSPSGDRTDVQISFGVDTSSTIMGAQSRSFKKI